MSDSVEVKKFYRTVKRTIQEHQLFPDGSRILIACSGGPDSMALADVLQFLSAYMHRQWHLGLVTVNHMIRKEGEAELHAVRDYAHEQGIPFYGFSVDIPGLAKTKKKSIETAGRDERYRIFYDLALREGYDYIAVGHHKNDQAETVLAHIIRGTGLAGLAGMDVEHRAGPVPVVRPLLSVTKNEILRYVRHRGLDCFEDTTNKDTRYRRNGIRHTVIPPMEAMNPNVVDALCRMSGLIRDDMNYIEEQAHSVIGRLVTEENGRYYMSRRALRQQPTAVQRRLWQYVTEALQGPVLTYAHHRQLSAVVRSGEVKTFIIGRIIICARCDTIKVYCKY